VSTKKDREAYTLLSDYYRKTVIDREDAQSAYDAAVTERDTVSAASEETPEVQAADELVAERSEALTVAKDKEGVAFQNKEAFRLEHEDAAKDVEQEDRQRADKREVAQEQNSAIHEEQLMKDLGKDHLEPEEQSPMTGNSAKLFGAFLAAHAAGHSDQAILDKIAQDYQNPTAITQQYNPQNPDASCERQPEATDIAKHEAEESGKQAQEQLDDNAVDLSEDLQKGTDKEVEAQQDKPVLPPTERSARELANTKSSSPDSDREEDHRWTRG
jgi:hypothetical protein